MAISQIRDARPLPPGTAACLGAFDGLHLGHQALIERARALGNEVALVTFDPHPLTVVAPERAPALLQSAVVRRRVADDLGIDHLVLLPFDERMATMSADEFCARILVGGLHPAAIVVGDDFRFGRGREGTAQTLADRLEPHGITVARVEAVHDADGGKLGATRIRQAVVAGDVAAAGTMLGRWHAIAGIVVAGDKRGRTLGFPTANVRPHGGLLPASGIYATVLTVWSDDAPDFGAAWPSVSSLGKNPTFANRNEISLETHVLDRDLGERLYGLEVEVAFVHRLRDEARFDTIAALVSAIERDVQDARAYLTPQALRRVVVPKR